MEHYFSKEPTSKEKIFKIQTRIRDVYFEFFSGSGIFSKKKIDLGTKLLAEKMLIKKGDSVLDLGCGIGILGIVAATLTKNKVYLTDINTRSCKIASMNAKGAENVEVRQGNIFEPVKGLKFDAILLNPPQTAGKEVCFKMITESINHLNKDGTLQLVARHNKGGETLSKKMMETFGNVKALAKKGGYRIYLSQKDVE